MSRKRATQAIEQFTSEDLTRYVQLLLNLYRDLQAASQPRFHLEIGMLKLVYAGKLRPIEEALAGMGSGGAPPVPAKGAPRASSAGSGGARAAEAAPPPPPPPKQTAGGESSLDEYLNGHEPAPQAAAAAPPPPPAPPKPKPAPAPNAAGLQAAAVAVLMECGHDFIATTIRQARIEESDDAVVVQVTAEDRTTLEFEWKTVADAVQQAAGRPVRVTLGSDLAETEVVRNVADAAADEPSPVENEASQRALEDPDVKAFQQLFPGQVREVRNLREYS